MKQFLSKSSEIVLFAYFAILPFAYGEIKNRLIFLFVVIIGLLILLQFSKKEFNIQSLNIFYTILFMLVFGYIEKVNFIDQFNIPIEVSKHLPLSTILLAVGMMIFLMQLIVEKKLQIFEHNFSKYFLLSCIFLVVIFTTLYPFLNHYYQMKPDINIQLLNHILKYLMILILTTNYISNYKRAKQINVGIILSLSFTVILSILL